MVWNLSYPIYFKYQTQHSFKILVQKKRKKTTVLKSDKQ